MDDLAVLEKCEGELELGFREGGNRLDRLQVGWFGRVREAFQGVMGVEQVFGVGVAPVWKKRKSLWSSG